MDENRVERALSAGGLGPQADAMWNSIDQDLGVAIPARSRSWRAFLYALTPLAVSAVVLFAIVTHDDDHAKGAAIDGAPIIQIQCGADREAATCGLYDQIFLRLESLAIGGNIEVLLAGQDKPLLTNARIQAGAYMPVPVRIRPERDDLAKGLLFTVVLIDDRGNRHERELHVKVVEW